MAENKNVIFKTGSWEKYNALETKDPNTLYFLTDKLQFWKGDQLFGTGAAATGEAMGLMSDEDKKALDDLVKSGVLGFTAVDASVVISDGEDGGKTIGVQLSKKENNAARLEDDGIYVEAGKAANVPEYEMELKEGADEHETVYRLKRTIDGVTTYPGVEVNVPQIMPVYERTPYEFVGLLDGARTDVNGKEIRVMFPEDAAWTKPTGDAAGRDNNCYYFGIRFFAPNDEVTGFKESGTEAVTNEEMEDFNGTSSGVDEYGRKFDICWFPAATCDDAGRWTYYGDKSEAGNYVGWYHTIEWYNASEKCVGSETVRINLTNARCHNSLKGYLGKDNTTTGTITWDEM